MDSRKIMALITFIVGFTLILIGGLYNPYSTPVTLKPGSYSAYMFHLRENQTKIFTVESLDVLTVYVANESGYQNAMDEGNFSSCYSTFTGKFISIKFTAPKEGKYYVIIANFNSESSIEATFSFGSKEMWPLIILGSLTSLLSLGILLHSMKKDKERIKLNARCPYCGMPINSSWNYCPSCRYPLRGDKK